MKTNVTRTLALCASIMATQLVYGWPSVPHSRPTHPRPGSHPPTNRHVPAPARSHRPHHRRHARPRPAFHSELAPHGDWIELSSEGWVWRPHTAAANRHWRPYVDNGYWIKTRSGLYWHSNYRWGHIPFHYGRWDLHTRYGWVWMPGTTWGPSWVTWRRHGSYYGWAPLPAEAVYHPSVGFTFHGKHVSWSFSFGLSDHHYVFVPSHHVYHHDIDSMVIPRSRVSHVYHRTSPVRGIHVSARHSYPHSRQTHYKRHAPSYPSNAYRSSPSRRSSGSSRVIKQKMRIPSRSSRIVPPAPTPRTSTKKKAKPSRRSSTRASSSSRRSGSIGSIFKSRIRR